MGISKTNEALDRLKESNPDAYHPLYQAWLCAFRGEEYRDGIREARFFSSNTTEEDIEFVIGSINMKLKSG